MCISLFLLSAIIDVEGVKITLKVHTKVHNKYDNIILDRLLQNFFCPFLYTKSTREDYCSHIHTHMCINMYV